MIKSVAVVVGMYMLSIALVLASDPLISAVFPGEFVRGKVPSSPALAASTAFFIAISVLCAWLCARFAPRSMGKHVLAFMLLGEALGLASVIPNWNSGWPHWYWLSWLMSWPVSCFVGLWIERRRRGQRPSKKLEAEA